MNPYIYLLCAKLHGVKQTKKLNNLPSDYKNTFYKDRIDGIDFSLDTDFQQNIVSKAPKEDVKNFLVEID